MKDRTTPMGGVILSLTAVVLLITAGAFIGIFIIKQLAILAAALLLINIWVYTCWTPVGYELEDHRLTIFYRVGSRTFENVRKCSKPGEFPRFSLKMWANGGLFAAAGLFWSRSLGLFYAYVTTTDPGKIIVVETDRRKIFISPTEPGKFLDS